jgi:hypothetical protein
MAVRLGDGKDPVLIFTLVSLATVRKWVVIFTAKAQEIVDRLMKSKSPVIVGNGVYAMQLARRIKAKRADLAVVETEEDLRDALELVECMDRHNDGPFFDFGEK